jgi:hypothetical protein
MKLEFENAEIEIIYLDSEVITDSEPKPTDPNQGPWVPGT